MSAKRYTVSTKIAASYTAHGIPFTRTPRRINDPQLIEKLKKDPWLVVREIKSNEPVEEKPASKRVPHPDEVGLPPGTITSADLPPSGGEGPVIPPAAAVLPEPKPAEEKSPVKTAKKKTARKKKSTKKR